MSAVGERPTDAELAEAERINRAMDAPQRWLAFDIGCIECGENSAVIGTYPTEEEARAAAESEAERQAADWHGQHSMEVFDLGESNG